MPLTNDDREKIVSIARDYLLTPYRPHGRKKGHGVDCATFLLCVYRDAGLVPDLDLGNYSVQIHLHRKDTQYLNTIRQFADEIAEADVQPGDIVLFKVGRRGNCASHDRFKPHCPACIEEDKEAGWHHAAIVIHWPDQIIHAVDPTLGLAGVQYSHGTQEGFTRKVQKRFFSFR